MSYNIMGKNASFKGDVSGTIENQVNDWDNQSIGGNKTFTAAITSSADVMLSGSGKISASFFYGDGTGLSGVAAVAAGADREVQFNDGGTDFGASTNFKFTAANELQVAGQISASLGISGSEFHGDGSNLTAVTASFVTASNVDGILNASQVNLGEGLEANANAIRVKLTAANSGLNLAPAGISLNINNLNTKGSYTNTDKIAVYNGATTENLQLSVLEAGLDIDGGQITGLNSISNDVLPTTIEQFVVSASTGISGAYFQGDGSGLTGVTASPTPAGSNAQIQFNDNGSLAGDADLTFLTGSDTLATTNVSASSNISGSSLYLDQEIIVGGQTFLDVEGDVLGGNASFIEITASSTISSSGDVYGNNFRGNGSTLNNVPLGSSNGSSVVFIDNAGNQTITSNAYFRYNGSDVFNDAGGFSGSADLQVGGHISGSGDLKLLNGDLYLAGTSRIFFDGDDGTIDVFMTERAGGNGIIMDGKNRIRFKADQYVIFEAPDSTEPILVDFNSSPYQLELLMALSSSQHISASAYATAGGTVITDEGNFQGNNAFFNEITGSSLFLESDSAGTAPQIHIHEDDTEYGRISFTNNADTSGQIGAVSHEWTLAGSSSAQGSPTDAQFNIFYGDAQGNGNGADILTINGSGSVQLQGILGLNCRNFDGTDRTDPSSVNDHAHIYSKIVTGHAEVFVRDSNGNVTQISPHTPEGEWQYFSRNTRTGKVVRVNMERMIRKLEEITGESFMEEWYEDPTDLTP